MEFNYNKDKAGWVKYKSTRAKIKLRKYIDNEAYDLARLSDMPKSKVKQILIEKYNEGGLKTLNDYLMDCYNKVKKTLRFDANKTD